MNEEQILKARLNDLALKSYKQNIYTYTSFLSPADMAVFDTLRDELSYVGYEANGGLDICERKMIGFGSRKQLGYDGVWPIKLIVISPLIEKFSDELSHRDFLGALMNLGIERSVLGDIIVKNQKRAYVFCQENIAGFIADNLTKIKHTNVKCTIMDISEAGDISELKPLLYDISCIVAAARFDAVVAALIKCSRSEAVKYFQSEKITLNGRICTRNSIPLKDGDIFSVRGHGKYIYCGQGSETKKGKIHVSLKGYR